MFIPFYVCYNHVFLTIGTSPGWDFFEDDPDMIIHLINIPRYRGLHDKMSINAKKESRGAQVVAQIAAAVAAK